MTAPLAIPIASTERIRLVHDGARRHYFVNGAKVSIGPDRIYYCGTCPFPKNYAREDAEDGCPHVRELREFLDAAAAAGGAA